MIEYIAASFIAMGIGVIAAIIGMGGGFLYVPTLTLIFDIDQRMAVGTSLAVMIFSSLSATICYQKQRKILYSTVFFLLIPSIFGTMIGSYSTQFIDAKILVALFTIVLMIISLEMLFPRFRIVRTFNHGPVLTVSVHDQENTNREIRIPYIHLTIWGAFGGVVSGVTGTSGGAFFVPALIAVGVPVHYAIATSLCTIIITSMAGAGAHAVMGQISLPFIGAYGIGAAIGAAIGAGLAPRIQADHIQKFFGIILFCIALLMIKERLLGI